MGNPSVSETVSVAKRGGNPGTKRGPPSFGETVVEALREVLTWVRGHAPQLSLGATMLVVLIVLQRLSRSSPNVRRGFEMVGATLKQALFFR